ncbi:MAG: hypothetical protein JXQ29_14670, partial [Planctomycetes bacterium]|nr:hypothetical protein [Planctomycetota bacterium]
MKAKFVVSALLVLSLAGVSSAQLSGNYTIDPNGSGPNNYTTWGAAIAALGAGVSGNVVFTVASTTFQETLVFSPITGVSSLATVTFQAVGAPAILDAGASANGLTISAGTAFLNFHNLEVRNFTGYGLFLTGSSAVRGNHTFTNCKFDAPATTSSSVRAAYMQSAYQ